MQMTTVTNNGEQYSYGETKSKLYTVVGEVTATGRRQNYRIKTSRVSRISWEAVGPNLAKEKGKAKKESSKTRTM